MNTEIVELLPGMVLYKHRGFRLYRIVVIRKNYVTLQKLFSDIPEPQMQVEELLSEIKKNHFKILSVEETEMMLKMQQQTLKKKREQLDDLFKMLTLKDKQFTEFRTHHHEFKRNKMRSQTKNK